MDKQLEILTDAVFLKKWPKKFLGGIFPKTRPRVLFLLARGMRGLFACFDTKLNDTGIQSRKMLYSVDFWDFVERDFRRFFPSDAAFSESHTVVFPVLRFRKITARFLESHTVVFVDFRWCYKSTTRKCFRRVSVRRGDRRGAPHSTRRTHTRVAGTFTLANVPRTSRS